MIPTDRLADMSTDELRTMARRICRLIPQTEVGSLDEELAFSALFLLGDEWRSRTPQTKRKAFEVLEGGRK